MKEIQGFSIVLLLCAVSLVIISLPGANTGICVFTMKGPIDNLAIHYDDQVGTTDGTGCFSYQQFGGLLDSHVGTTISFVFTYNGTGYAYLVPATTIMTVIMK